MTRKDLRRIFNWKANHLTKDVHIRQEPPDAEEREVEELQQLLLNAEMVPPLRLGVAFRVAFLQPHIDPDQM